MHFLAKLTLYFTSHLSDFTPDYKNNMLYLLNTKIYTVKFIKYGANYEPLKKSLKFGPHLVEYGHWI